MNSKPEPAPYRSEEFAFMCTDCDAYRVVDDRPAGLELVEEHSSCLRVLSPVGNRAGTRFPTAIVRGSRDCETSRQARREGPAGCGPRPRTEAISGEATDAQTTAVGKVGIPSWFLPFARSTHQTVTNGLERLRRWGSLRQRPTTDGVAARTAVLAAALAPYGAAHWWSQGVGYMAMLVLLGGCLAAVGGWAIRTGVVS